jgi:uncharacterized protein YdeI (YjbR/CyaY-like superfamily)
MLGVSSGQARFFATPAEFREWLAEHHEHAAELWVGFYKKGTGRPSLTWPESVDEALCYGWIDGLRQSLGEDSYRIRFTPRRARSTWSAVNLKRVEALQAAGRMRPAGLAAYEARDAAKQRLYSYERERVELAPEYAREFRRHRAAWQFFQQQPPHYRRLASNWVMSARREATRARRLQELIENSAAGTRIPPLRR